jgi:transposase
MAQLVCVVLSATEREQLTAIAADRNRPHKYIERAPIVLASADRYPAQQVAQSIGVSRPTVWRSQQRFAESGIDGLLRDRTRKPGKAPIAAETVAQVVAMTCTEPPHEATHWTGRGMAKAIGISLGSVQRIWQAHKLQPHRLRTFKRSRDPSFADKLTLYVAPPAHAVVLSIDEKSQIQALDRTQPGLPIKPGRCQTMTHNYKRHGTTTLFAALSVLDGTVIGRCMPTATSNSSAFSTLSSARLPPTSRSTSSSTTTPPTNILKCWPGWCAIRAGSFTSPRPRRPGSMRWRTSSPR